MLYLDLETYSECNLKQAGAARYAEDQTTEILLVAYAFDEDEVEVWDATRSSEMPAALHTYLAGQKPVAIHNSYFDRSVLQEVLGIYISPERIVDTMVQALSHGMPGALDLLGQIFALDSDKAKMKEGRHLVLQFCKPLRGARSTRLTHPTRWELFKEYAKQDVVAMRELHRLIPKWNYPGLRFEDGEPSEWHRLWVLDQQINDRGFLCDIDLAEKAVKAAAAERDYLNTSTQAATAGLSKQLHSEMRSLPFSKKSTVWRSLTCDRTPSNGGWTMRACHSKCASFWLCASSRVATQQRSTPLSCAPYAPTTACVEACSTEGHRLQDGGAGGSFSLKT